MPKSGGYGEEKFCASVFVQGKPAHRAIGSRSLISVESVAKFRSGLGQRHLIAAVPPTTEVGRRMYGRSSISSSSGLPAKHLFEHRSPSGRHITCAPSWATATSRWLWPSSQLAINTHHSFSWRALPELSAP
jgi:hypothetical protein